MIDQPDSAALEQAIERVRHDAARREQLVRNGLAIVGMFHAPVVAGKLKRIIAENQCPPRENRVHDRDFPAERQPPQTFSTTA